MAIAAKHMRHKQYIWIMDNFTDFLRQILKIYVTTAAPSYKTFVFFSSCGGHKHFKLLITSPTKPMKYSIFTALVSCFCFSFCHFFKKSFHQTSRSIQKSTKHHPQFKGQLIQKPKALYPSNFSCLHLTDPHASFIIRYVTI